MNILTIESTCDETAAAVVNERCEVLGTVVASQDELHRRFGGVVPEIASRAHVERILPVIDETLRKANITLKELDAVAVANTPGLAGSLLVGLVAAKSLAVALDVPLVAVNHLQAHIYACRIAAGEEVFPCVGLIVSGGHTSLYRCRGPLDFELLGATIDDAAGEAFDKVAAMLGLPYPGGPSLSKAAEGGNRKAYGFPRSFLRDDERLDFSFSGLKTAVRYTIAGPGKPDVSKRAEKGTGAFCAKHPEDRSGKMHLSPFPLLPPQQVADLAASFQEAVVDCLVGKAFLALRKTGFHTLCCGGGVAANARLRERLAEEAKRQNAVLHIAPIYLCTDNAVMGAIAVERLKAGLVEELDLDAYPGVVRKPAKI
ncbi:MAG: tRNA (adenosine(37)-N6)-threonylcarbamoyltransferase complex transferase subunit TsaD [Pirellulales bacterium]|nr:tRNA (adenosine(37)-N6)-threonylcarbamoyltransferase complex transferase subunit TsaD [Pirellulales bacterium]